MIYHLRLFDGTINQMDVADRSSHIINFETYDIRLDIKAAMTNPKIARKTPEEMTLTELTAYMQKTQTGTQKNSITVHCCSCKRNIPSPLPVWQWDCWPYRSGFRQKIPK